ncbi:hypothetical protein [Arthrobacter sp. NPDC058192]|uniref:hypothetical protein n=1 Tax=Arthrobacter sp. NPDC058192 TaxID=3346372 RepID=UPI0036E95D0E
MKKSDRIARDLEQSVSSGVDTAREWAAPRVEAAVNWAVPRLQHGLDTASPKLQEGLKTAAQSLAGGVAVVTPRLQESLAQLAPRINDAAEGATPRLHVAVDKAAPVIANARDLVVVEYLPRLSTGIGQASEAVHRTLESAPVHVDALAQKLIDSGLVHNVQTQAQAAGKNIKAAAADAGKTASVKLGKREQQKPKHRGLLILGVLAAAAAAGVAAWKASKPVEDPWKVPTPVKPAPVSTPTVTEIFADAADKAGAAGAGAEDFATAGTAKAAESTADAADKTADAAKDAADTTAETANNVATDAQTAVRNIASNMKNGTDKPEQ